MNILRAEHLGMCFGVRDAIALAKKTAAARPLTILGDLVHNESVLATLRAKGIRIEEQPPAGNASTVMITAHGASNRSMNRLRERGLDVVEATCPLVQLAHRTVAALVRDGFHPVIIGRRDHVEVRGITEDLAEFDVVLSEADVDGLADRPRFGVAAQTTQPIERVRCLVSRIRRRFPGSEVRFIDTVCQPTKQRQSAAVELARQSDVVIVIGGANSNNTRELVATCSRYCTAVHQVETAADLRPEWIDEALTVGVTAGTSTPDELVDLVEEGIRMLDRGRQADSDANPPSESSVRSRRPVLRGSTAEGGGDEADFHGSQTPPPPYVGGYEVHGSDARLNLEVESHSKQTCLEEPLPL